MRLATYFGRSRKGGNLNKAPFFLLFRFLPFQMERAAQSSTFHFYAHQSSDA